MGTYLVTHKYTMYNEEFRNTFYYVTSVGEPSNSEWQDIADEIRVDFINEMRSNVSDQYTLYGIDHRRVDSAGLLTFPESFTSGVTVGTETNHPLPTQCCLLVSNKGATTKPNRARTYLGGFTEAGYNGATFDATRLNAAESFIDLQSNLNGGGTNPLSRVAAQWNATHTFVTATNDLSGATSVGSGIAATQRRRRIGVGI